MSFRNIYPVVLAGLLVVTSGCSGSRLRNLISRSDYRSLEELEEYDRAVAEADEDDTETRGSLVSRERELTDDETDEAEEPKRSRFLNFPALFRRGSDDSELGPDPFVEEETDDVADDNRTDPISRSEAERLIAEAAQARDEARALLNQALEEEKKNLDRATEEFIGPEIRPAASDNEKSFADFLEEKSAEAQAEIRDTAAEKAEPIFRFDEPDPEPTTTADASASDFDRLLGKSETEQPSEKPGPASPSEIFPGLDDLIPDEDNSGSVFGDRNNSPKTDDSKPTFDSFFGTAAGAGDSESQPESTSPFSAAAETVIPREKESDPWAKFRTGLPQDTQRHVRSESSPGRDAFSWPSTAGRNVQTADLSATPEIITPSRTESDTSVFSNVSSQRVIEQPPVPNSDVSPAPLDMTGGSGLVIPTEAATSQSYDSEPALPDFSAASEPFVDDTDPFAEAAQQATAEDDKKAEPRSSTIAGFSTRTLFLLLGCVIVALLLFMPERQSRSNP